MNDDYLVRQEDLIENPTARVPVCIALDVSGSMRGDPIQELNNGILTFFEAIKGDDVARYAAEICVVTFGLSVEKVLDFMSIDRQDVPAVTADGPTPMGAALNLALDLLEARKADYKNAGVDYYQPWLVIMTDGEPTDDVSTASQRIANMVAQRKLTIFPIAIGPNANLQKLAAIAPGRPPLRLIGLNFAEFFLWLSQSISTTSASQPGESVALDIDGIAKWGQV